VLAFVIFFSSTEDSSTFGFVAPLVESGTEVDEDYYLLWRLEQGIPEGSVEIPKGLLQFSQCTSLMMLASPFLYDTVSVRRLF
jgi:hypothetical protein